MSEYLFIKLLHLIGFAYWLGGDLGVFCSSFAVTNEKLSAEARVTAAKILFVVDQGPRIAMTMMLPLGTHLAWRMGVLPISDLAMAGVWIVSAGWLANVIYLHRAEPGMIKTRLMSFDFGFRAVVSGGLIAVGTLALMAENPMIPYWVAAKFLIFGALVACRLVIRIKLKPFMPAFASLAAGNASADDNLTIRNSLGGTRPVVVSIWIGLLASAAFGLHLF